MKINSSMNSLNIRDFSTQQSADKKTTKTEKVGRVEEIKEAIKNGTYKIDIESTAKAMAKHLL
jgi:anti-sigma28 factor (negative regulator of flagellin synthesis)